jgi:MFS family permease
VFTITYLTIQVKTPFYTVLLIMFIANLFQFFAMIYAGHLSDKIGRKHCILLGYLGLVPWALVYFSVLDTGSFFYVTMAVCVGLFFQALCYGPEAAVYSEIFPTRMRYSGVSFCYQISSIFAGSIAPLVATILLRNYATTLPIVIYLLGVIVLSLGALALLRETSNISLHDVDAEHLRVHGH